MSGVAIRLTSLAHGGGCGCKLAPAVLQELLADQPVAPAFSSLLVGTETGDDAAVWQLTADQCVIATTDFFTPLVDDATDFGRIAATNAISDVYAMGGRPLMRPGDALILTKALGVGVYSAALKKDVLGADGYAELLATTTLLNSVGAELARDAAVHGMTDVTGFGLLGHGLEMARGARLRLVLDAGAIPLLARAADLARAGFVTGASNRNWASYGAQVACPVELADWERHLLTDPQTSGGLLVSVAPAHADRVLRTIREAGYPFASIVGRAESGTPGIRVTGALASARR